MIVKILNKLLEYSDKYFVVRNDMNLPMPAYSFMDIDINNRFIPTVSLNPNLFPQDENVLAHILSHEWGHHVLGHIKIPGMIDEKILKDKEDRDRKEDEADAYAAAFIKEYFYNKTPITEYIKSISPNYGNRIEILNSI